MKKDYYLIELPDLKTADEATQFAINWQIWASERSISYGELCEYQGYFRTLAEKFNLLDEFKENDII